MNRTTLLAVTLLSALATPVVVHATGLARTEGLAKADRPAAMTVAASPAAEPACLRPIKVVYAGYGEAKAAPCAVAKART